MQSSPDAVILHDLLRGKGTRARPCGDRAEAGGLQLLATEATRAWDRQRRAPADVRGTGSHARLHVGLGPPPSCEATWLRSLSPQPPKTARAAGE